MKYLVYFFVLAALCGLNSGLAPYIQIHGQGPNLLFLFIFILAIEATELDFMLPALLAGLFLDFYSGATFGSFTAALLITVFFVHKAVRQLAGLESNLKYLSLVLLPAQVAFTLIFYAYGFMAFKAGFSLVPPSSAQWLSRFLISFSFNLVLLYPIYILVGYLKSFMEKYITREYKVR